MRLRLFFLLGLFVIVVEAVWAMEPSVVKKLPSGELEVTGSCFVQNISPEEAKKKAEEQACLAAIEYVSGIEVKSRMYSSESEKDGVVTNSLMSLLSLASEGIITEKQIVKEETLLEGNSILKRVTLKVKVGKQNGEPDYRFRIEADLNKQTFTEGENLIITIKPSIECYLMVFNVCSNDIVYCIYPNVVQPNRKIKSGEEYQIPDQQASIMGLELKPTLLPGKQFDTEIVKVIAVKKPDYLLPLGERSEFGSIASAREEFLHWLLSIPRNQIEEVDIPYTIYKK